MKFSWNCVKGFGSILLSQSVDRAVEEFVLQNNKQPIRKPSDKLRQDRPKIFFPQVKLADLAVPPPGEDLHMVKLVPYEPPPLLRTESVSSKVMICSCDYAAVTPSRNLTIARIWEMVCHLLRLPRLISRPHPLVLHPPAPNHLVRTKHRLSLPSAV
jgi:hypothetical protein